MSDSDSSDHYEPVDDVNDSGDENAATKSPLKTDESGKNQINTDPPEDESDQGEEDEENDHPEQDEEILEDVLEDEEILDDGDNMADGTEPSTPTDQPTRAPVDRLTQLPLSRIKNLLKNFDPDWKGQNADAAVMLVLVSCLTNTKYELHLEYDI